MSSAVLAQVYDEMRRLAIAGSAVAAGDFRLKKLVPPLEKSAEKAPVFGKVAQAAQAVIDSNDKTASAALLELATLVNAILYTQGETGIVGELKPLETTDLGGQPTQASARILKPLLEALSSTGSGRLELIRDAYDRGTFRDLRLVKPALAAIDDPYPEIGQFIVEKVLPLYGKAIVPQLRARLEVKGRGGHVHRLQLLHELDPAGSRDLIQLALSDGSKEMKVAAVECLGTAADDVAYLLEQGRSKMKDVRAAALRAMTTNAAADTPEVVAAIRKAIDGDDLALIISRVRRCGHPEIRDYVLEQAEKHSAHTLKCKDSKLQGPAIARLQLLVASLDGRSDPKAETFLLSCFEKAGAFAAIKSDPSGTDLNEWVADILARGTPTMQRQLVAAQKSLSGAMLSSAMSAARVTMPPADFYAEFSSSLKGLAEKRTKKNSDEFDRANALLGVLTSERGRWHDRYWASALIDREEDRRTMPMSPLDPRWLDAAVDAGSVQLACQLARSGHARANEFLAEQLGKLKSPHESQQVLHTMVRIGHPAATDLVIDALKKLAKETTYYYLSYWFGRIVADLPKSALPRLEELLPKLPDKMVDQLMDSVLALNHKPD